jgi:hypothetical protein
VIGNGDAVQTFGAAGRNQVFRTGNTVSRKKRMRMQVDIKRHGRAALNSYKGYKVKKEDTL